MKTVAFNVTKVYAERLSSAKGKMSINNNVDIVEVKKGATQGKKSLLTISFTFKSQFEPKFGSIELAGEWTVVLDEKLASDAESTWKKKKELNKELLAPVMNVLLSKSHVLAIALSKEVNLPPPLKMPSVKAK